MTNDYPAELTRFQPLRHTEFGATHPFQGDAYHWNIFRDEMTGVIEAREKPFRLGLFMLFLVLCVTPAVAGFVYAFLMTDMPIEFRVTGCIVVPLAVIGSLILFPLIFKYAHGRDADYWGKIRFRYDPTKKTLEFPHDETIYGEDDREKIVLGCLRGCDCTGTDRKRTGSTASDQYFFLIRDHEGKWRRHNFSCDQAEGVFSMPKEGPKHFRRCVELLRNELDFETLLLNWSKDECAAQQQSQNVKGDVLW